MKTTKYTVWQVGWESEARQIECEGDHETGECPACTVSGLPPREIVEADPVVIGFRRDGELVEHYRRIDWRFLGPCVAKSCREASEIDKIFARERAEDARLGRAPHWHNGQRVHGGVS